MTPKEYLTKKSFCTLPWLGVYIQPDGDVRNCAITNETLGNINEQPLKEILLGETNKKIKNDMLNDVLHSRCSHCHMLENNQKNTFDQTSNRVWYIKTLAGTDLDFFDSTENYKLKMLDLRWSNACNFACVYCGPDLSSAWAKELNVSYSINNQALAESLEYIYSNLDTVEHVYLAGGEPLLIKENLTLLNKIYEVNPNIEIRINTNLSIINAPIYNLIKKFKNVHWTISVENIGEEFEYVRYGGNWNKFVANLAQLRQDFEKINFNLVWFVLCGSSILDCIDFLQEYGFHENTIIVNPLNNPNWLHVSNLDDDILDQIRLRINKMLATANPAYALHNSLTLMLNYISGPFEKDLNETKRNLKKIDQRRNLDSSKIFKEVYRK